MGGSAKTAASRVSSPAPRAAPASAPAASSSGGTAANKWQPFSALQQRDIFSILALAISALMIYGYSDDLVEEVSESWAKDHIAVFCAKLAVCSLAFAACFSGVIHLWIKAASSKDMAFDMLSAIGQSLLIICAGYVGIYYLQHDSEELGIMQLLILYVKSLVAATIWLLGLHVVCRYEMPDLNPLDNIALLAEVVFLICYSAGILSYIKQDWEADVAFLKYWIEFLVLFELPLAGLALTHHFAIYAKDITEEHLSTKMQENLGKGVIALALCGALMYVGSSLSIDAFQEDVCDYTCGYKLEVAATFFACGCVLIAVMMKGVFKLDLNGVVKELVCVAVVGIMVMVILIAHDYEFPKWATNLFAALLSWLPGT